MDKNKPPGISFDDVILRELVFSRKEGFSDGSQINAHFEPKFSFSPEKDKLVYELSCEIKDEKDFFYIRCAMIGFFSVIKGQENMGLEEYSSLNAPAAVFPYIREVIASTTQKAGIAPVIIPPVNLNLAKQTYAENEGTNP